MKKYYCLFVYIICNKMYDDQFFLLSFAATNSKTNLNSQPPPSPFNIPFFSPSLLIYP